MILDLISRGKKQHISCFFKGVNLKQRTNGWCIPSSSTLVILFRRSDMQVTPCMGPPTVLKTMSRTSLTI